MDQEQFEREYIHTAAHILREIDNLADILAKLDHSWLDDSVGSSGDPGPFACNWYGVISDKDKGFHAIVRQNSDGFNYCETYDTADECANVWRKIIIEAMENALENDDYEYFGDASREELVRMIEETKALIK
jgi:hypothetical protein